MTKIESKTAHPVNSMAWHIQCHKNQLASLVRKKDQLWSLQSEVRKDEEAIEFYTKQINTAAARGLKQFDETRLLRRKHAKA